MTLRPQPRPVSLNLLQIRLPVPGVVSIGHRLSGIVLVLCIPLGVGLFARSLSNAAGFAAVVQLVSSTIGRLVLWLLVWALLHHLLAGLRHLALDLDWGVDKTTARASAWVVLFAAPLITLLGVWLP